MFDLLFGFDLLFDCLLAGAWSLYIYRLCDCASFGYWDGVRDCASVGYWDGVRDCASVGYWDGVRLCERWLLGVCD